ncbi:hypothetical protein BLNAU_24425 [Blattamonas nauphoetae]|uniref:Uncharacterized protein n=1 Tax=Blattamonas nauphoetae TaxID=2049346 RepID=A0ABQ9WMI0_9EUKA|nr:hypothetical protein BLNAU_24425 [Blattamonas nauphoetae]
MILETRTHLTVNKDDREVYAEESKSDREQLMNLVRYFLGRFVDLDEMALPDISVEQRDLSVESHLLDQQGNVTNESESLECNNQSALQTEAKDLDTALDITKDNQQRMLSGTGDPNERVVLSSLITIVVIQFIFHLLHSQLLSCAPIAMDSSQPLILPVVSARAGAEDLKEKR